VTQSIPIDGLVETPWSAVDRGNCKSDPEAKIAAPARKSHHTLIRRKAAGVGGVVASAIFLYSENSRGLKPWTGILLHLFSFIRREGRPALTHRDNIHPSPLERVAPGLDPGAGWGCAVRAQKNSRWSKLAFDHRLQCFRGKPSMPPQI